jgi:hypothetical protein
MAVSCGLIRVALERLGYSRKKARFCGPKLPNTQHERKTREFIQARKEFVEQERKFVSIDETSFGRVYHNRPKCSTSVRFDFSFSVALCFIPLFQTASLSFIHRELQFEQWIHSTIRLYSRNTKSKQSDHSVSVVQR